jgi:hypothetical protein
MRLANPLCFCTLDPKKPKHFDPNAELLLIDMTSTSNAPRNLGITSLIFASLEQLRARKVVTRSRARSTGKFPSLKMKRMLQWESENEKNAMYLLESNPAVTELREQPCEIHYCDGLDQKLHYPDLYVVINGVKEIWEVKTEAEAMRPEIKSRTALMTTLLPSQGYQYKQMLDVDLRKQPYLNNAKILVHGGIRPVSLREWEGLRRILEREGHLSWSDACSGVYGEWGRHMLCRLVLDGQLEFDRASTLSPATQFVMRKAGK